MTDEPPLNWRWRATCDPCKGFRHRDCWGTDPARAFLCVCDLDRCLPPPTEESARGHHF